jgi:peptidyl-prolyl cis-trans isomerase A (cyclophilin A)
VAAFQHLIKQGVYKDAAFYRVLKSEEMPSDFNTGIIQGGVHGTGKKFPLIPHESTRQTGLSHLSGTLSMARTKPGTASSEFFICIGDQSPLDAGRRGTEDSLGMAAFGKVIDGMDVVKKIQNKPSKGDAFVEQIAIKNIKWID